jgi:hypothetical protein
MPYRELHLGYKKNAQKVAKINIAHKCCNASLKVNNNNNNLLYIICQATPDHNVLQILPPLSATLLCPPPTQSKKGFCTTPLLSPLLCCILYQRRGVPNQCQTRVGRFLSFTQNLGFRFCSGSSPKQIISGSRSSS